MVNVYFHLLIRFLVTGVQVAKYLEAENPAAPSVYSFVTMTPFVNDHLQVKRNCLKEGSSFVRGLLAGKFERQGLRKKAI